MIGLGALGACTAARYERQADRTVRGILGGAVDDTLGARRDWVVYPESVEPTDGGASGPSAAGGGATTAALAGPAARDTVRFLRLEDALETAIETNRQYLTELESLYLTALTLTGARHTFSPRVSTTLSYLFADAQGGPWTQDARFSANVSKILDQGGRLTLGAGTGALDQEGADGDAEISFDSSYSVRLVQPLLRGGGSLVTLEPLRQAERNLVYAIRDFELFREDFSIEVARRYYDLVQQKQSIANQRRNYDGFVFSKRQAEALFEVGRTSELDVLRARRSELNSRNSLLAAQETYQLALDRFRIFLGLPPSVVLDVADEAPAFVPVDYEVESAVEVAFANRLDLFNRQEQLQDAARAVRIARNALLPTLDLTLDWSDSTDPDTSFLDQTFDDDAYSVGVSLGLPTDRVFERNAYRSARIAHVRARRDLEQFRDNLLVGILSSFRELTRRRQSLEIQRTLIDDQEKNVRIAQLRYERGDVSNRDKVEAEEALLDARNSLIQEQVNYEIARLQLLRDLGILFIDERGVWTE